ITTAAINPRAVASGVGVWTAAIRTNSTPSTARMICTATGIVPSSFGPIKDKVLGSSVGSIENKSHNGKRNKDANTANKRDHLINVPTAGDCLYSSACSKWSKYVVGKIMTLGDVSTISKRCPSKR